MSNKHNNNNNNNIQKQLDEMQVMNSLLQYNNYVYQNQIYTLSCQVEASMKIMNDNKIIHKEYLEVNTLNEQIKQNQIQDLETKLNEIKINHNFDFNKLKLEHETELIKLKVDHENSLNDIKTNHENILNDMKIEYENKTERKILELMNQHQLLLNHSLSALDKDRTLQIDEMKTKCIKDIKELDIIYQSELNKLKGIICDHVNTITNLKQIIEINEIDIKKLQNKNTNEINQNNTIIISNLKHVIKIGENEISNMKNKSIVDVKEISILKTKIQEHNNDILNLQEKYEREKEVLKEEYKMSHTIKQKKTKKQEKKILKELNDDKILDEAIIDNLKRDLSTLQAEHKKLVEDHKKLTEIKEETEIALHSDILVNKQLMAKLDEANGTLKIELAEVNKKMCKNAFIYNEQLKTLKILTCTSYDQINSVFTMDTDIIQFNSGTSIKDREKEEKKEEDDEDIIMLQDDNDNYITKSWELIQKINIFNMSEGDIKMAFIKLIAHMKTLFDLLEKIESINKRKISCLKEQFVHIKNTCVKKTKRQNDNNNEINNYFADFNISALDTNLEDGDLLVGYKNLCEHVKIVIEKQHYFFYKWIMNQQDNPECIYLFDTILKIEQFNLIRCA